jgi:cell division protein FtsQ
VAHPAPGARAQSRQDARHDVRSGARDDARHDVRSGARDAVTEPIRVKIPRARRGLLGWGRENRRVGAHRRSIAAGLRDAARTVGRWLWLIARTVAAVGALGGAVYAGRLALVHVVASPRFAVRAVRVSPAQPLHVSREALVRSAGVVMGDRLLALDTDAMAERIAAHAWIAAARVRRELPSTVVIEVTERQAAALAVIGGLYLVDALGHPFKRATLEESEGLVVLTGISRGAYALVPEASQAVLREALEVLNLYQHPDGLASAKNSKGGGRGRPALSEIHVDARTGYSLILYDGGGKVRLGRGDIAEKLARFDAIWADLARGPSDGLRALRVLHLDGPASDRVPIRFSAASSQEPAAAGDSPTSGLQSDRAPPRLRP